MLEIGHKSTGVGWLAYDKDETVVVSSRLASKVAHIVISALGLLPFSHCFPMATSGAILRGLHTKPLVVILPRLCSSQLNS